MKGAERKTMWKLKTRATAEKPNTVRLWKKILDDMMKERVNDYLEIYPQLPEKFPNTKIAFNLCFNLHSVMHKG